ncbi:11649_t:CDS:10 [Funneliformis caledonium]|uniref:11649_t:CDS:1 n=1 Tax=Funneliformis caledonium TaxID=1117310 RepID=A0A9N9C6J0_9GLOM|nr:11649_t:CDS:10 [Funneliformis caledonium]
MNSLEVGQSSSAKSDSGRKKRLSGPGPTNLTEELVYQYALRVAYLVYLTQPKIPKAIKAAPSQTVAPAFRPPQEASKRGSFAGKDSSKTTLEQFTNHLVAFQDIFKDEKKSMKSNKIPKELIKILRDRLGDITTGRDRNPDYQDPYLQRDLSLFYHSLQQQNFRKQFKESTKIEDIVLAYLKIAQDELKKAQMPANIKWQAKLTEHVVIFVGILKECLLKTSSVTPEMMSRLEIYLTKMSGAPKVPPTINGISTNVEDMAMVKIVQAIFNISPNQAQKDVNALKNICSEQSALEDLRNIINHVNRGANFPACRDDFDSDEAYNNWKRIELKQITENIAFMIALNPDLNLKESTEIRETILSGPNDKRSSVASNPRRTTFTGSMHPETMNDAFRQYEEARSTERSIDSQYQQPGYTHPYNPQQLQSKYHHSNQTPYPPYSNPQPTYPYPSYNNQPYPPNNNQQQSHPSYNNQQQPPYPPYNPPYHQPQNSVNEPKEAINPPIESSSQGDSFTFIPQHPRNYYKYLMYKCIDYELMSHEEASFKILSKNTLDFLNECGLRWRVSPAFRWLQYLDAIKSRYDSPDPEINSQISLDHLKEGFHLLNDAIKKRPINTWTISDKRELIEVISGIHDSLLRDLKDGLSQYFRIKPQSFEPILSLIQTIYENELFQEQYSNVLSSLYNEHRSIVIEVAIKKYQEKRDKIYNQAANEVHALISIVRSFQEDLEKLRAKFPKPLIKTQIPLFIADMENATSEILKKVKMTSEEGIPVEDIFELYREVLVIKQIFLENCHGENFTFNIQEWFGPHVRKWLEAMDSKTPEWVDSAVKVDKFKAVSATDSHSSSVVDLFTSFNQTIDFLKRLNWPNEFQSARYMTSLSRTVSKALEQYCNVIEGKFKVDMFPPEETEQIASKQSAWYIRAKTAMATDKAVPLDIKPESCVKINNIEAAREQLDSLYNTMDVDYLAQIIRDSDQAPPVPEKVEKNRYLYTIKIVQAENLPALDTNGSSDPYCVLSDEKGMNLVRTRVIYETLNPRWDEAFDITIESSDKMRWLCVTVWDRDQVGSDDVCGKAYIKLDPKFFDDFLAHDVWLDLDPHGRILLRISMEGEKDDIQFYFGKAFRTLKRAHDDMARIIVDRLSPFLRKCLSRDVIAKLVKNPTFPFSKSKRIELTDMQIEEAIHPLFDYFDPNLMTLNSYLHPVVFTKVMTKVWKEIESIIEELLVPPLSDRPSEMKPLNDTEVDVVIKWLKFLHNYLHADGNGLSKEEVLENQNTITVKKSESISKSVMNSRNLGTIKNRKSQKRKNTSQDNSEIILRILRMRSGTKVFLKQQMEERAKKQAISSQNLDT